MRDQDKSILIVIQVTLQPLNMFRIQIVGRLVKKQNVRFLQQKLAQKNLGALPAA